MNHGILTTTDHIQSLLRKRHSGRPCAKCGGNPEVGPVHFNPRAQMFTFSVSCHSERRVVEIHEKEWIHDEWRGAVLQRIVKALDFKARPKLTAICAKQSLRRRRR